MQNEKIWGLVGIATLKNRRQVNRDQNGRIEAVFMPGDKVDMKMSVEKDSDLTVFTGRKGQVPQPVPGMSSEDKQYWIYEKSVEMKVNASGVCHINFYEGSGLRFIRLDKYGNFYLWEVAVVAEEHHLYLTRQKLYSAKFYRDGDKIVCPSKALSEWPEMVEFGKRIIRRKDCLSTLEPISNYQPPADQPEPRFAGDGVVQWYSVARGAGAIKTTQGLVKIHWSQVVAEPGQPKRIVELKQGQYVCFEGLREPFGDKHTSFKLEATGVLVT